MSRYIDADKFIDWLDVGHYRSPDELCLSEGDVKDFIDLQPTADVVEVVRCKDCIHYTPCERGMSLCCRHIRTVEGQDFCNYGVRKEYRKMTYEDVKRIREKPTIEDCDNKELARMIDEAIEKQIPKKPKDTDWLYCPSCGIVLDVIEQKNYCGDCGQKIDWSDGE